MTFRPSQERVISYQKYHWREGSSSHLFHIRRKSSSPTIIGERHLDHHRREESSPIKTVIEERERASPRLGLYRRKGSFPTWPIMGSSQESGALPVTPTQPLVSQFSLCPDGLSMYP